MSTTTLPAANGHFINLTDAAAMTLTYRTNVETILATGYRNTGTLPLSETFNRADLDSLLAQTNCEGIRIYYGMDENLKTHAILVAVNESNEDILPSELSRESSEEGVIIEMSQRCPDHCPPDSPLNS